jgi:cGMP-dependent protein kinase
LGKGKYGNVVLVHNTISLYAIKTVSKAAAEKIKHGVKFLLNEKNVLLSLNHPFIIKLVKTLKTKSYCFFLLEYSTGKTLDEVLKSLNKKYDCEIVKFYGGSLFLIVKYLHKMCFIHRDIKPNNIMIDINGYVKLVDFGASKKIEKGLTNTKIGTPLFMAPEILEGKEYGFSCDYFSIGVCLYFIYFGQYPFGDGLNDPYKIYKEIVNKKLTFENNLPQNFDLNNLIKLLLIKNPSDRICNFKLIKNHSFYRDFEWDKLFCKKLTPPYIPNNKYNDAWLQNLNTTFLSYLEGEKMPEITNKISSRIELDNNNYNINLINTKNNNNWFEDF